MGKPKPDFEVFMNEQRLSKTDYKTSNMENTECLTFDETKRNDKGDIIICAHNCFGEKNITFSLAYLESNIELHNVDPILYKCEYCGCVDVHTKSSRMSNSR